MSIKKVFCQNIDRGVKVSVSIDIEIAAIGTDSNRKKITVNSVSVENDYPISFILHNTIGSNTSTDIYIDNLIINDTSDIRVLLGTLRIPFSIVNKTQCSISITFLASVLNVGDNIFYIEYNIPKITPPYKIACVTDTHYDSIDDGGSTRTQALTSIDNFVDRMSTYKPDLSVNNGDKTGASTSDENIQVGWYESNINHFSAVAAYSRVAKDGVAPGNHDFEYLHFASVKEKHTNETWLQPNTLYGCWESPDYLFVSLDSNYDPNSQNHMDYTHQGFGYINTDQLEWLTNTLTLSTKPVIIFCHHPLGEMDTAEYTLTKEIYHVQNRVDVRSILEASRKVVCVLHGHVHWFRADIINSIPYLCMEDIGTGGAAYHRLPANTEGKWSLIEIDKESKTIRFIQEYRVDGTDHVIYNYSVPYKTSFDEDISNNPEMVFANGYESLFQKSSVIIDPSQIYINNLNCIWTTPSNIFLNEPILSSRSFKVEGISNDPNYGRATWGFAPQSDKFRLKFSVQLTQNATKFFKLINIYNTTPSVYFGFQSTGNIFAYNGFDVILLQSYSINKWYNIDVKVDMSDSLFNVYIDGVLKGVDLHFKYSSQVLKTLEIVTETGDMYLDFVRVEKYATVEPIITSCVDD